MKILIYALLTLLSISVTYQAQSQLSGQAKIDSLLAELPNAKGDTNEVVLLYTISHAYFKVNPDKGIDFGKKGVDLAKKINWDKGLAKSYNSIGLNYTFGKGEYDLALEYFNKSKSLNFSNNDSNGIAGNYGNIGSVFRVQSKYSNAIEYYLEALEIYESKNNKSGIATILGNLGLCYYNQNKYEKAFDYMNKALEINIELNNRSRIATSYGNIGSVYLRKMDFKNAIEYYNKALKLNKEIGNNIDQAHNLGNLAIIYSLETDYQKGLEFFQESLEIHKKLGNKYGIATITANIGELYMLIADSSTVNVEGINEKYRFFNKESYIDKAIEYILEAKELEEEMNAIGKLSRLNEMLHEAYFKKGEYKKSLLALRKHKALNDSIYNQKNADKIAALEKAREDDLKQKEIEKQKLKIAEQEKREQLILYFSIGFIIVMAVVMFIIYRLLKRSDKLLYNVLPVSIAKRLKKKEHPISDYFTQASIVFIDIVNFTELAKDEDPRRVVEALNKIFTHYDTIANKYGLEKIKTIGDSYMAAAGIPEVQKDNTHRAAQMALEVKQLMSDYTTADGTKIEVRIGLDCGPVVAGVIGENKFIYDMWSDAVNTASRMESSSESGHVHITDRFKEAVSEYEEFDYVERGEIEIKGKGMMKTYYIEERKEFSHSEATAKVN